jgi:hypothetical protein
MNNAAASAAGTPPSGWQGRRPIFGGSANHSVKTHAGQDVRYRREQGKAENRGAAGKAQTLWLIPPSVCLDRRPAQRADAANAARGVCREAKRADARAGA